MPTGHASTVMRWIPNGASLALETCDPHPPGFDFAEIFIWRESDVATLERRQTRITGVLGVSDGTWCSHRRLTDAEWQGLVAELGDIPFWDLSPEGAKKGTDQWWELSVYSAGKKHSVRRYSTPNEIQRICKYCYALAANGEYQDSSALEAE
jgi:hypothetical protein